MFVLGQAVALVDKKFIRFGENVLAPDDCAQIVD
jgi:hypothetical protein